MASTGLLWAIVTAFGLYGVRHEAQEINDAQLSQAGHVLLTMLVHEMQEGYDDHALAQIVPDIFPTSGHPHVDPPAFVARDAGNRLVLHSKGAQPLLHVLDQRRSTGFDTISVDGKSWRVLMLQDPGTRLWIAVAQATRLQEDLARELAYNFITPLLLALPMLGIIIHVAVKRGLSPLRRLTAKVTRRSVIDLTPLTDAQVPTEALPLTHALDDLLQRLEHSHQREQRFIADATHELRTPLAGLKTQAQVALRAADDRQRTEALEGLVLGVDRAARLITQLLTLARLDHQPRTNSSETNKLLEVVRERCIELSPQAVNAGIELILVGEAPCPVRADRTLLTILIRNLIENAIQYGGSGKQIVISVQSVDHHALLTVRDQGPGIPPDDLNRVFERFYRGTNLHTPGSGLGLSIVKGIAESCDARVTLSNHHEGGLSVATAFRRA
jgi:two-component system sensor histidine kinase QseC